MLIGDEFMPELYLRQPGFTCSACGLFSKHRKRIQKWKETGDFNYIYQKQLDKACFTHNAAYANSKDLAKRTGSDRFLRDRAYEIALNPKYDG